MFITNEILERYNACESGKKIFNRLYPNGVEIIDLLDNRHIPDEILHWGAEYLPVSAEELEKYYERVNVVDSTNCSMSSKITKSNNIFKSINISNSNFIKLSQNVIDSENISSSQSIKTSKYVNNSISVEYSELIVNSKNITKSINIANSSDLDYCFNISNGKNLLNCDTMYNSSLCEYSGFSSFLIGCHKVLFCSQLNQSSFMLFNKPISEPLFYEIWEQYKTITKNVEIIEDNSNIFYGGAPIIRFDTMFKKLGEDFKNWVKILPNYDNFIMYQITLNPIWLN